MLTYFCQFFHQTHANLLRRSTKAANTPSGSGSGSFEVLTLGLTLGNGSGTDFQVSQCIPMEAATLASTLPLGLFIP